MRATRRLFNAASTVNPAEISFFSQLSQHWWNERGEFALLHRMNPVRVGYIRDKIADSLIDDEDLSMGSSGPDPGVKVLSGMDVLDVGCGGGLLAESLARLGGRTLGIDASESNIKIASLHASQDPQLSGKDSGSNSPTLRYLHTSSEELLSRQPQKQYDVVCSLEVLEHVDNAPRFLRSCADLVKPGGHLFLSTISRTPLANLLTITLAEDVLRLVSQGTHTYSKFIKPTELVAFFRDEVKWITDNGGSDQDMLQRIRPSEADLRGIAYLPFSGKWSLIPKGAPLELDCNYIFWARKPR